MVSRPHRMAAILCAASLLAIAGEDAWAARGPSTQEERDKALSLVQQLESDPLGAQAPPAREWLTMWLIEVPDVTVKLCASLLPSLLDQKKNYAPEILAQMMFSSAAFIIRSAGSSADDVSSYTAGLEGALRSYEAVLKVKPKARWEELDALLKKRDEGKLKDYVLEKMAECK